MADQAYAGGTFYGATVTFTTATTLTGNVKSVKWSGLTRKEVDTTHLLSTSGMMTYIPSDMIEGGDVEIEAQYSTQLNYQSLLIANRCDTVTITFPKRGTTCGGALATTAATIAFSAAILSAEPDWSNDNLMTIKFKLKVSGSITSVAAVA